MFYTISDILILKIFVNGGDVMIRKIKLILRWVFGVFWSLFGFSMVLECKLAGIFFILFGFLILPLISEKIPHFKGKRCIYVLLFIIGILGVGSATEDGQIVSDSSEEYCETEQVVQQETTVGIEETTKQEIVESSSNVLDKAYVSDWIVGELSVVDSEQIEVENKDMEKIRDISEEDFCSIWQRNVLEYVELSDVDYEKIFNYLERAVGLYDFVYSHDNKIDGIKKQLLSLEDFLSIDEVLSSEFAEKYSLSLEFLPSLAYDSFYITQRLGRSYSDTISGMLQKEIDTYKNRNKTTSDWVAYDVEYIFNDASPGDIRQVIRSNVLNPFPREGAYNIAFVDTGKTMELSNISGFVETVPIYLLVDNPDDFEYYLSTYLDNDSNKYMCLEKIKELLGKDEDENIGYSNILDIQVRDFVFSDSSYRRLDMNELEELNLKQLRIARNEIYARHGYIFEDDELNEYFKNKNWYVPVGNNVILNEVELYNIEIVKQVENRLKQNN